MQLTVELLKSTIPNETHDDIDLCAGFGLVGCWPWVMRDTVSDVRQLSLIKLSHVVLVWKKKYIYSNESKRIRGKTQHKFWWRNWHQNQTRTKNKTLPRYHLSTLFEWCWQRCLVLIEDPQVLQIPYHRLNRFQCRRTWCAVQGDCKRTYDRNIEYQNTAKRPWSKHIER
jgi:hypothetical protein